MFYWPLVPESAGDAGGQHDGGGGDGCGGARDCGGGGFCPGGSPNDMDAEAGPLRRWLLLADFYVLEGCIEYRGGVAKAGHFAREPMGAVHERTSFPEETVYLFTSYGPLAMYGPEGNIAGITDAELMHGLLEAQRKGGQ